MKKIIAVITLMFSFSLMAYAQQVNMAGCATLNGIQICGNTNGTAGAGVVPPGVITNGAGGAVGQSLMNLIVSAQSIVNLLVPFGIGLAVVAMFYGIIMFMFNKEDAEDHAKWLKFIGMSLVGLFVMVSIWGLVAFMGSVFGISQGGGISTPALPVRTITY